MLSDGIQIRRAMPRDCDIILHHRRFMFRDMGNGTDAELDAMAAATRPWLLQALANDSYRGWLAETGDGRIIAGGGILISSWPARPEDPNTRRALILNVYTEPSFRRGLARELMLLMISWLRDQGFQGVVLHASAEGRPLYESLDSRPPTRCVFVWSDLGPGLFCQC